MVGNNQDNQLHKFTRSESILNVLGRLVFLTQSHCTYNLRQLNSSLIKLCSCIVSVTKCSNECYMFTSLECLSIQIFRSSLESQRSYNTEAVS